LSLVKRNYHKFAVFIESFLPASVSISDPSDVVNEFASDAFFSAKFKKHEMTFKPANRVPLFTLEMLKTQDDSEFLYSTPPIQFVKMAISLLEKALDEIAKVPDLEPKILSDLYKSQKNESYIKTPLKPKERPLTPNPADRPRKYPDENKWLWEVIESMREKLMEGIEPLERYMEAFNKFKPVLHMNPDDEARKIEMDE
jgi:dynein heavy chain, axonemal